MTSIQYEIAVPFDKHPGTGVNYMQAHALGEVKRIMAEIRATGKCGEFTVKWNGSAWEFRKCEPPIIVRE